MGKTFDLIQDTNVMLDYASKEANCLKVHSLVYSTDTSSPRILMKADMIVFQCGLTVDSVELL